MDDMTGTNEYIPLSRSIQLILDRIAPGSTFTKMQPMAGSYTNLTYLVLAQAVDGTQKRFVVRNYKYGNQTQKACTEYKVLHFLQECDIPAPRPMILDEKGEILGSPGIVISYVPGKMIELPGEHPEGSIVWARKMGTMLARIHNISSAAVKEILLDANTEATWFLRGGVLPDYMRNHPDGERVWQTVHNHIGKLKPVAETLVHIDYWRGNILWDQGKISAVIDWEEAAYGDPAIDVGYCLMELVIMGMMEEAMEFLRAYEMLNGPPANLYFWALAATARPMYDIDSWITNSEKDKRFRRFITNTILRL